MVRVLLKRVDDRVERGGGTIPEDDSRSETRKQSRYGIPDGAVWTRPVSPPGS